jgi:hypothetical protein
MDHGSIENIVARSGLNWTARLLELRLGIFKSPMAARKTSLGDSNLLVQCRTRAAVRTPIIAGEETATFRATVELLIGRGSHGHDSAAPRMIPDTDWTRSNDETR